MEDLIVERVWCCVCSGSGKLRKFLFWKRDCHVCDGTGKRPIMMDSRFPDAIKQQLRVDAMYGANTYAALTGRNSGLLGDLGLGQIF